MADARQPLLPGNGADVDGGGDARESSAAAAAVEARLEVSSCRLYASVTGAGVVLQLSAGLAHC
jgi:hypothetical protein